MDERKMYVFTNSLKVYELVELLRQIEDQNKEIILCGVSNGSAEKIALFEDEDGLSFDYEDNIFADHNIDDPRKCENAVLNGISFKIIDTLR